MIASFEQLGPWLIAYKYAILFPVAILEGPIVTIFASFLASLGHLNVFAVYAVSVAGDLTGDTMYYSIGRWGRVRFIEKYGRYVGLTMVRIESIEKYYEKHDAKTLIFGKWSQVFGAPILAAAGMAKVPYWRFIVINTIGTIPKCVIWVVIGYYFGQAYAKISAYFNYATYVAIGSAVLFLLIYFILKRKRNGQIIKRDI